MSTAHAIAQLRHLYAQMIDPRANRAPALAAQGILGPAIEELERANAPDSLALADALAEATAKALDGMDQAGGDRDGMPECPWCGSQDAEWHEPDCGLVLARAALAAYRESRR